jgi:hypothetical protein
MQQILLIAAINIIVLLVVILILIFMRERRKKKSRNLALEMMADDFGNRQTLRLNKLTALLAGKFKLESQISANLASQLTHAEKQYITHYIEAEMQESLEAFYPNLNKLLDSYLYYLATELVKQTPETSEQTFEKSAEEETEQVAEDAIIPADSDTESIPVAIPSEPPPDWGDVFD